MNGDIFYIGMTVEIDGFVGAIWQMSLFIEKYWPVKDIIKELLLKVEFRDKRMTEMLSESY